MASDTVTVVVVVVVVVGVVVVCVVGVGVVVVVVGGGGGLFFAAAFIGDQTAPLTTATERKSRDSRVTVGAPSCHLGVQGPSLR